MHLNFTKKENFIISIVNRQFNELPQLILVVINLKSNIPNPNNSFSYLSIKRAPNLPTKSSHWCFMCDTTDWRSAKK